METLNDVFQMVSDRCRESISDTAHKLWIQCLNPIKLDDSTAYLHVKSEFQKGIIEQKYMKLLQKAFAEVLGFDISINITCDDAKLSNERINATDSLLTNPFINQNATPITNLSAFENSEIKPISDNFDGGEYEYTFSSFIVGSSNKFAHAASLAVADRKSTRLNSSHL